MEKLIDGLITVVVISIVTGQYPKLRDFAIHEAQNAMMIGKSSPIFFSKGYEVKSIDKNTSCKIVTYR